MEENYDAKRKKTLNSMWRMYFMVYFCVGIFPVNINNLLLYLPGTTKFGLGVVIALFLVVSTISILIFGYFEDKISERNLRKKVFVFTNITWVIGNGLVSLSVNYYFYLIFIIISAIGLGAFLPMAFSVIGDYYPPKERGKKFGVMQSGLILGSGIGIIIGGLLGNYAGPYGWRFAYGLGSVLGLLTVLSYSFSGSDPERARAEPEFEDFEGEINYNYKITFSSLAQLFKKKSVAAILIYMLTSGIAVSTLTIWAIYYLSTKFNDVNAGLYATTIYLLAGIGALPGVIIGGKIGDRLFNKGKLRGRVIISIAGLILGILCFFCFYLIPFFTADPLQIIFSWIFFIFVGFLGFFFTTLCVGNIFAIYTEVCPPELRGTANALNGLVVNMGGIIGNLLLTSLIERNMSLLPFAISLVLLIWLFGTLLWIIPFFYYPKESKELRDIMTERRKELDKR